MSIYMVGIWRLLKKGRTGTLSTTKAYREVMETSIFIRSDVQNYIRLIEEHYGLQLPNCVCSNEVEAIIFKRAHLAIRYHTSQGGPWHFASIGMRERDKLKICWRYTKKAKFYIWTPRSPLREMQ